jgi:hypothetical protein
MTMGQLKVAKREGESAWQLLARSYCGDKVGGILFKEYVKATKGKSSLQWTPGLKAELGVDTDEEKEILNEENELTDILLATLTNEDWHAVTRAQLEGLLLDLASARGMTGIESVVQNAYRYCATIDNNCTNVQ